MSYTPTTWTTGDTITATKLNKMEQGIAGAGGALICNTTYNNNNAAYTLDTTAGDIYDALLAGKPVYIRYQYGGPENYSGTMSFAQVVRFSNYNYDETLSIYATRCYIGQISSTPAMGSPSVIRYRASGLDGYPTSPTISGVVQASLWVETGEG